MRPPLLEYHVVDVFTDRAYSGNPLAVVLDAEALSASQLQAVAREFNLSETAFPLRPTAEERAAGIDYRLRICTPVAELPFAGHPSVGAAWVLARLGRVGTGRLRQACGAGVVDVHVDAGPGEVELTGARPVAEGAVPVALALRACGLAPGDVADDVVGLAGTGLTFGYLQVADDAAVERARPDLDGLAAVAAAGGGAGLSVFSWDAARRLAHARVFAGDVGVPEDPATGSAALGFGAHAVRRGLVPGDGETAYTVLQGAEIGRPSRLRCRVEAAGGVATRCRVAGGVVPVSRGEIVVPG